MKNSKRSIIIRIILCILTLSLSITSFSIGLSAGKESYTGESESKSKVITYASDVTEGTYYEIFVRSFADSNGDGIGDFNGITAKLDYLNDGNPETDSDLGITGIWLTPIFSSPSVHGYDITDYYCVNSKFGTMEDFENLVSEANKRGIKILLDLVINHSSAEHPWFKASQDPESNYRSWYIWSTTDNTEGYDLKASAFDNPSWHKNSSGYYAGIFGETLPDFNYEEPAVREEMKQIAKFWLEKGVAGFRLDAAKHIYDASKTKNGTDSTEKAVEWWKEFSDYCKTINPDAFLLGEIWDTSELRYEYMSALDSSFVFDIGTDLFGQSIKDGKNTDNGIATTMKEEFDNVASKTPDAIDSLFLSNHDTTRINTTMENRRGQMKLTAALNLTMQGLPFVYYGEEIGMLGDTLGTDTNVRTPFLWGNEDSMTTSWFSDYSNDNTQDANAQSEDPYSLLSHYRKLIQLRAKSPALYKGVFEPIANGNEAISSYEMQSDEQTMLIIHNLSTEEQTAFLNTKGRIVFTTNEVKVWRTASSIVIPPLTTVIIER